MRMYARVAGTMLAAVLVLSGTAVAGDKAQGNFVNPIVVPGTGLPPVVGPIDPSVFVNGVSGSKSKADVKCKLQMQLKKLVGVPDSDQVPGTGDEIICIAHAHTNVDAGGANLLTDVSTVLRAEVKNGAIKIKTDLVAEGIPCVPDKKGGPPTAQFGSSTACYAPDGGYSAAAACAAVPGLWLPFASDGTSGVCTVLPPSGTFVAPPASPVIAVNGIFFRP